MLTKENWLISDHIEAVRKADIAQKKVQLSLLSHNIFLVVYKISLNENFAYQIAKGFNFDRISASSEFEDFEKQEICAFQKEYKNIIGRYDPSLFA